jgi:hypothetical protein
MHTQEVCTPNKQVKDYWTAVIGGASEGKEVWRDVGKGKIQHLEARSPFGPPYAYLKYKGFQVTRRKNDDSTLCHQS